MTIKIEFPSDNKEIGAAMARALTEIYGSESYQIYTAPGVSKSADVDLVVSEGIKHAEEHVHASHAQLAKDGANINGPFYWIHPESDDYGIEDTLEALEALVEGEPLVEQVSKDVYDNFVKSLSEDVPPPVVENPKPPVTDAATQEGSAEDLAVNAADTSDFDVNGLAWDKRIHSKNKSTNTDGSWRNKRRSKEFETDEDWKNHIAAIESELKGDVPPPSVTEDVPPPVMGPDATAVFGATQDVPPPPATEDVPPPPATEDVLPPPASEYKEVTFGQLMTLVSTNMKKGSAAEVDKILTDMGIMKPEGQRSALPVLKAQHESRIPEVYAKLEEALK